VNSKTAFLSFMFKRFYMSQIPNTAKTALACLQGDFNLACVVKASFPRLAIQAGAKPEHIMDQPVTFFAKNGLGLIRLEPFRTAVYMPKGEISTDAVVKTLKGLQVHDYELEDGNLAKGINGAKVKEALFNRPVPRMP
jgi:hypothetical protein